MVACGHPRGARFAFENAFVPVPSAEAKPHILKHLSSFRQQGILGLTRLVSSQGEPRGTCIPHLRRDCNPVAFALLDYCCGRRSHTLPMTVFRQLCSVSGKDLHMLPSAGPCKCRAQHHSLQHLIGLLFLQPCLRAMHEVLSRQAHKAHHLHCSSVPAAAPHWPLLCSTTELQCHARGFAQQD